MNIVDFHSHILPYADHGSDSLDTTITQLKLAQEAGVQRIVFTPHYYPHRENPEKFIERREKCYNHLMKSMTTELVDVRLGAEVLICDSIEDIPMLDQLCIRGTKVLLLELPFVDFTESYVNSVRCLLRDGYDVILAHADRYDPDNINRLISAGARIQLNADSISGLFIKKHIKHWLEQGYVYAIGSDIHGTDKHAYKTFKTAIKKISKYSEDIKSRSDLIWNMSKK